MHRIILFLLLLMSYTAQSQYTNPPYTPISTSGYWWKLPTAFSHISLPAGCDTATAFHTLQSRRMGAFFTDTCDKVSYVWMGYWKQVGSGTQRPVYGTNGLTNVNDSTIELGGTLAKNTTLSMGGYNWLMPDPGLYRIGAVNSSLAQFQNNVPAGRAIGMHGQYLSNSVLYTVHRIDTVTAANLSALPPRLAQFDRRILFSDNNMTMSDKEATQMHLYYRAKDSVRIDPQNSDLAYVNKTVASYGKFPGYAGRTIFQNGLFDFDFVTSQLNETSIVGTTSSSNYTHLKGYTSASTSYLIGNVNDSLQGYAGYVSTGKGGGNPFVARLYNFVAGAPTTNYGKLWSLYSLFEDGTLYNRGDVGIGFNASYSDTAQQNHSSAKLQVNSTTKGALLPRMTTTQRNAISTPATGLVVFDTDEDNYYMNTSSGWQPMGGSGELFARDDARNNSGTGMYFNAANQYYVVDSIEAGGSSYNHYYDSDNDVDYFTGFWGGNRNYQLRADNKAGLLSSITIIPEEISLYGKGASLISLGDSVKIITPHTSSDSSIYKPLATDADGNAVRMDRWPTGGGGGSGVSFGTTGQIPYTNAGGNNYNYTNDLVYSSGQLLVGAGLVATPSVAFAGDPNTGFYNSSADVISFSTGGARRVFFSSNGIGGDNANGPQVSSGAASATVPTLIPNRTNPTSGVGSGAANVLDLITSGTSKLTIGTDISLKSSVKYLYRAVSSSLSISATSDYYVEVTSGTPTLTLPTATSNTGLTFVFVNSGAGTAVLSTTSSQVIGNTGSATSMNLVSGASITVFSNGSAWRLP